jgi:membrane fusion protein, multidrug efflux system
MNENFETPVPPAQQDVSSRPRGKRPVRSENRNKRRFRVVLFVVLAASAVGGLIVLAAQERGNAAVPERVSGSDRTIPVQVVPVTRQDFVEYGEYLGETRGIVQARLTAAGGGVVQRILAEQGDRVAAGTSLAEIDRERMEARYRTAVLNEQLARENWEREQRFLQEGNSFQLRVDQAHLNYLQARSALLDAQRLREGALAVTPISGTVVARYIDVNDDLESGDPTFHIADLSRLRISVGIPETDIAGVRELNRAELRFSSFPGQVFPGEPTSFARVRSDRTLSFRVDIEFDNPGEQILSGQTARVRLELRRHPDVVVVPSRALYTRNNRTYLMVVDDGAAREVEVQVGVSDGTGTVIRSGLDGGERLVADGFNRLAHGTPVTVVP